jgi:hypothetical protein
MQQIYPNLTSSLLRNTTAMKIVSSFILSIIFLSANAQSIGPNSPGTISNEVVAGSKGAWTTIANAAASDNAYAITPTMSTAGDYTDRLVATNFGFAIPAGNTIIGITATVEKSFTGGNNVTDREVMLVKGGVTQTVTNKALGTNWPATDAVSTYGSSVDLWGNSWTLANVNASNFGIAIAAQRVSAPGAPQTARVDHITITVSYTTTLPVDIKDFFARKNILTQSVTISWKTLHEENMAHYTVERSANGSNYYAVASTNAFTGGAFEKNYTVSDNVPLTGNNFYRLLSTDKDGSKKYSDAVVVKNSGKAERPILVQSNFVKGTIRVIAGEGLELNKPVVLSVFDNSSKLYSKTTVRFSSIGGYTDIPAPAMSAKLVFLVWQQGDKKGTEQIMVAD